VSGVPLVGVREFAEIVQIGTAPPPPPPPPQLMLIVTGSAGPLALAA
jgi:hypothetical protein